MHVDVKIPRWALYVGALVAAAALGSILTLVVTGSTDENSQLGSIPPAPVPVETMPASDATSKEEASNVNGEAVAVEDPKSCDSLGINGQELQEGTCASEDGSRVTVVNSASKLRLKELNVKLLSVEEAGSTLSDGFGTERANGTFVIVRLAVTNKLNSPAYFEDGMSNQVALGVGKGVQDIYTPDFDAANGPVEDSFVWQGEEIQPNNTQEGAVIFDMPNRAVKQLDETGNIRIANFSDLDRNRARLPTGIIRTYN